MNQLPNISVQDYSLYHVDITDALIPNPITTLRLSNNSIIELGTYSIRADELVEKLHLLDRLITEYLPEELI